MEESLSRVIEAAGKVGLKWDGAIQKFRDASGAVRGISEVKARLEELERSTQKAAAAGQVLKEALSSGFQNVLQGIPQGIGQSLGSQLLAPFRAVQEVIGGSGKTFVDLDEALRQTLAAAGEGNERFDSLARSVTGLASSSAFSSKELAGVTTELARAGFSIEGLSEALPGIQAAAAASGEGLAETTQNMITALGGFQLGTEQAGRVADVMTVAANAAAQSTSDVGEAFKYVAPVAKSLGITLEDTAAATILLANAGIKGSQAGTALRTGLGRLAQTAASGSSEFAELSRGTGRMGEVAQRLALNLKDVHGNLLPLPQLIATLKQGTDGLASTEKALVMKLLFGDEAGSSWVSLLNNSTAQVEKAFSATNNAAGTAAKTAAQNLSGISGALKLLEGAIGGFQASVGGVVGAVLLPFVRAATQIVNTWSQLPASIQQGATVLVGLAGAAAIATAAVLLFNAALRTEIVTGMIAGLHALSAGFTGQLVAQKAAAAFAAAQTALQGLASVMQANLTVGAALSSGWKAIGQAFLGFIASIASADLGAIWASITAGAAQAGGAMRAFLATAAPLAPLVVAIGAVAVAWDSWSQVTAAAGEEAKDTDANLKGLADGMAKLGTSISTGQTEWGRAVERVGALQAALDRLRSALGLTTAEQASVDQQTVATSQSLQKIIVATDQSIEAYKKAAAAAKDDAEAQQKADAMRQQIVQTLERQIGAWQQQLAPLQARIDAGGKLTEAETLLKQALEAGIRALNAQEGGLAAIAGAHGAAAAGASEQAAREKELSAELEKQKGVYQDAIGAMEQAFKNWKDQQEEGAKSANAPIEASIKATEKAIKDTKEAAEEAQQSYTDSGKAASAAYDEAQAAAKKFAEETERAAEEKKKAIERAYTAEIDGVKAAAAAADKAAGQGIEAITEAAAASAAAFDRESRNLQAQQQAEQRSAAAKEKAAAKADAAQAKRDQDAIKGIEDRIRAEDERFQKEERNIQQLATLQRKADEEKIRVLQAATPAEQKLAALEKARLQETSLKGGEEGLRAQAQLERMARQVEIERVQAEASRRAEAEKAAAAARQEALDAKKAALEAERMARQAEAEKASQARQEASLQRQEAAQASQEAFQAKQAQLEEARRQAEARFAAERKAAEDAKQRQAEAYAARIKTLEAEKAAAVLRAEEQISSIKEKSRAADQKAAEAEKTRKTEGEKDYRAEKEATHKKVVQLEESLAKLKERLTEQEKQQKQVILAAEKDLNRQKIDLENKYKEALGRTNDYIVRDGVTAWKTYAAAAVAQLNKVAEAQRNAAKGVTTGQAAYAIGGPISGGQSAYVNELGQEAFLSSRGDLSLINAPMWGTWRAPTSGTVIPAALTAALRASGAFNMPAAAASSAGGDGGGLGRLLAAISGGGIGRQTNHVTIQSTEPVSDASRMLVEMSRLRARSRR
jgi:TP901 family phage tail tape measure protein